MMALVFVIYVALTCLPSIKAEDCQDCGTAFERTFVLEGEPVFLFCPSCDLSNNADPPTGYNFTWYKKDNGTSITTDALSRTYASQNKMVFYPAKLEDAGYYACVKMNSTNCWKKLVHLTVYKNRDGLCYSTYLFLQTLHEHSNEGITCPGLSDFITDEQYRVMWYKECELLKTDGGKFKAVASLLKFDNVTKADEGRYLCKIFHEHNGEIFNVSRAIDLEVKAPAQNSQPVIIYPKNEKLYVKIGSPVELACNVSYTSNNFVTTWEVNNEDAEYYFNSSRVFFEKPFDSSAPDGTQVSTLILNITEVKREDYGLKFVCVLQSPFPAEAYITLLPPGSDGKLYDAYVLFPRGTGSRQIYPMSLFVLKVLPEVLEGHCGYKLFIFGRDDLPGEAVSTLIDEAVKKSRRLIMILTGDPSSKGFYDEFEQHITLHDALINSKTKTILIELEKIDFTEVPESVKYIKRKQGTIRWKGDFTEQALSPNTRFWKRVRYRMPPAQEQPSGESISLPVI
ncbi:interleukin-1 receptor type 1-like isoform X2 [Ambystoma mexicanum]|uniref:interleukin-1 receptor type 1-like isoform X2 n=1 Tax=Ambystoma mexicanum TaxID=8296 RepID=UPI0037E7E5FB